MNMPDKTTVLAGLCFAVCSSGISSALAQASDLQRLDTLLQGIETLAADVVQLIVE